jgi:hypothetical protein
MSECHTAVAEDDPPPESAVVAGASLKKPMSITDFLWSRFFEPNDRPEKNGSKPTIPSRTGVLLGN